MMKFVVLIASAVAVVSAYYEDDHHNRYHGPHHYPIITKHGVPLETPEVRDAKIHHHIAHEVAAHQQGGHIYNDYQRSDYYSDNRRYADGDYHNKYHGPKHYPIITKQGVPLETPEVRDAKIHHHIALEVAAHEQHNDHYGQGYGSGYAHGSGYGLGLRYGQGHGYGEDHYNHYSGPKHYPIITKQGVPLDTPEVRDAKLHHHIAVETASHGNGIHDYHYGGSYH